MQGYRVGICGATGLVGRQLLQVLEERRFPVADLVALASRRSAGSKVRFQDTDIEVREARPGAFQGCDLVFFAAGTDVSRELAPVAVQEGAVVIDKSNAFRMDPEVPLVVPEINGETLRQHKGIIASPNCSTTQLVMALHPLRRAANLERVLVSTYQAVTGTGADALDELESQVANGAAPRVYPRPIAFNVLPHCDSFGDGDYTGEEWKLVRETRRILGLPDLKISATAVRVPVRVGHSESVWVQLDRVVDLAEVRRLLAEAPGVQVMDDPGAGQYPTPLDAAGNDDVWVGRIRRDPADDRALWMWIVSDNLRKGAATNAVQIAEQLSAWSLI
ncbi:MAG: aspartate-semialdehyde dehydrogenase [Thermaerobacter sp.]|nr:aspartate-semialdehyde dehydrogenase [Bacillota bacterium]REJ35523.1 MAG: aspartate-semialdehyde dehydrogenase [Bacillota bacterium]